MYVIKCDGNIIHSDKSNVFLTGTTFKCYNIQCNLSINSPGELSFDIFPGHLYYENVLKMKSEIELYQNDICIFSGRCLNDDIDIYNTKHIICEGALAYLYDSNQRTAEYHNLTVKDYLTELINKHNEMVEHKKKFLIGSVTVTDSNDSLYRISNYENTFTTIKDKLIDRLGGQIIIRYLNGNKYLNYVYNYSSSSPTLKTQDIIFGENMIDISRFVKCENISTAIIPLGAKIEGSEERLDIKSVNNDVDYVFNQEAVNKYGWIWEVKTWDDVTVASNLLNKANEYLNEKIKPINTIELTALDLSLIDKSVRSFSIGESVRVYSKPHEIDTTMIVSEINIDISNPANSKIVLGKPLSRLTSMI